MSLLLSARCESVPIKVVSESEEATNPCLRALETCANEFVPLIAGLSPYNYGERELIDILLSTTCISMTSWWRKEVFQVPVILARSMSTNCTNCLSRSCLARQFGVTWAFVILLSVIFQTPPSIRSSMFHLSPSYTTHGHIHSGGFEPNLGTCTTPLRHRSPFDVIQASVN